MLGVIPGYWLRQHAFDERAIHDAAQVIGYFNDINRITDALGVESEDFIRAWEIQPDLRIDPSRHLETKTQKACHFDESSRRNPDY